MEMSLMLSQDAMVRPAIRAMMIGLAVMTPSLAYGFSQDGFHDGMTLSEVEKEAERQGYGLSLGPPDLPEHPGWKVYPADKGKERFFDFCQGRLAGYHRALANVSEAIVHIDGYRKAYGVGKYLSSVSKTNQGKYNLLSFENITWANVQFTWKSGKEYVGINIAASEPTAEEPNRPVFLEIEKTKMYYKFFNYSTNYPFILMHNNEVFRIFWSTREKCDR